MSGLENIPALRFPEFDGNFKKYKLGELAEIRSASRVHKDQWVKSGVPFFRTSDVVAAYKGLGNKKAYISMELYKELSKKSGGVKKNDLLVTGGGSIGIPYLVKSNEPLYFKDADLLWFKNRDSLNGFYLYTFFSTCIFKKYLSSISHVGTIAHYTIEQAKSTTIKLPTFEEQEKVGVFLCSVDKKIDFLTEKHELLTEYKKGVMQQLFDQQIRFKDEDGNAYPAWEEIKAEHLFYSHSNKKHNSDLPILAATQDKGVIPRAETGLDIQSSEASVASYKVIEPGDFLISLRSFQGGIEYSEYLGIGSPAYTVLKPKKNIDDTFYKNYFKKEDFISRLSNTVVGIRDGKQISYSAFATLKLPYPCIEEQDKIANFLTEIDHKIDLAKSTLEQTKTFKKGLLQKMFV